MKHEHTILEHLTGACGDLHHSPLWWISLGVVLFFVGRKILKGRKA